MPVVQLKRQVSLSIEAPRFFGVFNELQRKELRCVRLTADKKRKPSLPGPPFFKAFRCICQLGAIWQNNLDSSQLHKSLRAYCETFPLILLICASIALSCAFPASPCNLNYFGWQRFSNLPIHSSESTSIFVSNPVRG